MNEQDTTLNELDKLNLLYSISAKTDKGISPADILFSLIRPSNKKRDENANVLLEALKIDQNAFPVYDFNEVETEENEQIVERFETIKDEELTITQSKKLTDELAKINKAVLYIPLKVAIHKIQPIGLSLKDGFDAIKTDALRTSKDIKFYGLRTAGISLNRPTLIVPKVSAIIDEDHDRLPVAMLKAGKALRDKINKSAVIDWNLLRGFELLARTRKTARKIEKVIMDNGFAIFGMMDYPTVRNFLTTALNISMPQINLSIGRAMSYKKFDDENEAIEKADFFRNYIDWFSGLSKGQALHEEFIKQFKEAWKRRKDQAST